ncbi:hypothetical protein MSL71_32460 [Desulfoluna butyratoxydans]|uniref:Uncharacterized protein n=1 Tax=Desulfoluna butyratoxydans TaxID=231438 RepID=A0A4U8YNB4_9BACT|nr:hypothetical protein MSL71_32460 [Desulfoluna butyratoxydans]
MAFTPSFPLLPFPLLPFALRPFAPHLFTLRLLPFALRPSPFAFRLLPYYLSPISYFLFTKKTPPSLKTSNGGALKKSSGSQHGGTPNAVGRSGQEEMLVQFMGHIDAENRNIMN